MQQLTINETEKIIAAIIRLGVPAYIKTGWVNGYKTVLNPIVVNYLKSIYSI